MRRVKVIFHGVKRDRQEVRSSDEIVRNGSKEEEFDPGVGGGSEVAMIHQNLPRLV